MITPAGRVKLLDFGLAVRHEEAGPAEATRSLQSLTEGGAVAGTLHYLAPEVLRGEPSEESRDLWAMGVLLYEMLAGRLPFEGEVGTAVLASILQATPESLHKVRPELPMDVERIVAHALDKSPDSRYRSAGEIHKDLTACHAALSAPIQIPSTARVLVHRLKRPSVAVPAVLILLLLGGLGYRALRFSARKSWATEQALPEVSRLADAENFAGAFRLALEAERYVPGHPALARLLPRIAREIAVQTEPAGAQVYLKPYSEVNAEWQLVGLSPIAAARISRAYLRWKIVKPGYQTSEVAPVLALNQGTVTFTLHKEGSLPAGMVRVPG